MNELKLQIREHIIPDQNLPECSRLNITELVGVLDFKTSVRCSTHDFFKYEDQMRKKLANDFKYTLYGEIIRAIDMAECETQANRFNYSTSADERISKAFLELRKAIPEMTHD
ncbi:MAG: hypothetical protein FMNOHCHN_03911 [Ignavibacteriaceae bacterium]|nr:hypothetical protein [Ignavibacteriaceae bacterium]